MFERRYLRSVHPSWLLAITCLGIVIGLMVSSTVHLAFASFEWVFSGIALLTFGFVKKRVYILPFLLLAGILMGAVRGGHYYSQLEPYAVSVGNVVTLEGKVSDDSDVDKSGKVILRLKDVSLEGSETGGFVWLTITGDAAIKRGDIVTVKGKLAEGFGSFAASMHRAELVRLVRPVPGDIALKARDWFADGVRLAIPEPEASLGIGFLVGQRRSLPEELDAALKAAGLTHIVVASGYNLTILVNISRRLLLKVSKFLAMFFSGGMIVAFIAVTGMSPSMSRAGLVAGLGLLAWYYGRKFHPLVLLPLAAAITLLIQPAYAYGDLGWQLSFASFAGVLIVAPLVQNYFFGSEKPGLIRQIFIETMCAFLCTVPLIVLVFGQFSNVAILANVLILPLVPLAMLLTFVAGVASLTLPTLAGFVGLPATIVLGYMTKVSLYLGNVPWAQTTLAIGPYILAVYYIGLVLLCLYTWRKTRFNFIGSSIE